MGSLRWRAALAGVYLAAAVATIAALLVSVDRMQNQLGADYTSAASNIVRGQQEAAALRHASEAYLRHPTRHFQQRVLRVLQTIESREGTTRNSFARLGLRKVEESAIIAEFEAVLRMLPPLRRLAERMREQPELQTAFRELAYAVENKLAFTYSKLHQLNHQAAAEQQQLVEHLSRALVGLGTVLVLIIGALLWSMDKVVRQRHTMERLTVTDPLTDLPNRRAMLQQAEWAVTQGRRYAQPVALALLDVDHFKRINDEHGHPGGDRVLQGLGQRLTDLVRGADLVARLGGEEFAILMPNTDAESAGVLCERIRAEIENNTAAFAPEASGLTVSIGFATSDPHDPLDFDTLYTRADEALYLAKDSGRNRVVASNP